MGSASTALATLLNLLEDEFRGCEDVRVRPVFPSSILRSPDLEQDYDPESSTIHKRSGVTVQARRKDYFFPVEWLARSYRSDLDRQIEEIREFLDR